MMKNLLEQNTWRDRDLYYFSDVVRASDWQTGPIQPLWWDLHWLPLQPDGAGNLLCIDLTPASGGKVGQIIDWDHECGPARVLFSSFQDLLSAFVDSLEGKVVTETVPGFPVFALDPENEDDEGDDIMEFRVRADVLQPQAVISKRVVVPARDLETTFASLLFEERAYLKEDGYQPSLSPPFVFVRYHEYRATGVDVEVGLPVMGEVAERGQITATYLPAGEVAAFKDKDIYDHSMLAEAFRAIEAWSKAYQRELLGMPWIVYFVNAQDPLALPNTSSLAEVYWLLKKE
jgi:hypothetical protein